MTQVLQSRESPCRTRLTLLFHKSDSAHSRFRPKIRSGPSKKRWKSVTVTSILQPLTTTRNKSAMHYALLAWPTKYG